MKKVIGYCRVSTQDQANEGESLEAQENKIKDYCKLKNLELISCHKELGVSGTLEPRNRPQLSFILASLDIKKDSACGLVVTKIDRLSRSTKDFVNLISEFQNKNIDFYSINPDMDSSTTMGKFTMNLLSVVANLERDMISDRTKEVMQDMKKRNLRVGSVPFGKKLKENSNILEDDLEELETMRLVKDLRAQTKEVKRITKTGEKIVFKHLTYKEICEELVKRNRLNKDKNNKWFPEQIRKMLHNGDYKSGRKIKK